MKEWYAQGSELLEQFRQPTLSDKEVLCWNLGQCGFVFRWKDLTLAIDPMLNDLTDEQGRSLRHYASPFCPKEFHADVVLCTHAHIDHMAPLTLQGMLKANPDLTLILPAGCRNLALSLGFSSPRMILLEPGCVHSRGDWSVSAFSTAHPVHDWNPESESMCLGYRLQLGAISITHLGDTYLTASLRDALLNLGPTDLFLPPINGDDLFRKEADIIGNMEPEEAARLAVTIGANLSIPTHYDMITGNTSDPLRFASALRNLSSSSRYLIPALGERWILRK